MKKVELGGAERENKNEYLVGEGKIARSLTRGEIVLLQQTGTEIFDLNGQKLPRLAKPIKRGVFGIPEETLKKAEEEYKRHYSEDEEHWWDK